VLPLICPERSFHWVAAAVLSAVLLLAPAGCLPPDYGPAPFACRSSPTCPEGYRCVHGVCRRPGGFDAGPSLDWQPVDAPLWDWPVPWVDGLPPPDQGACVNPTWIKLPLPVPGVNLERVWGGPAVGGLYALGWIDTGSSYSYHVLRRATASSSWSVYSAAGITTEPWDIWGTGSQDLHLIEAHQVRRYAGGAWGLSYDPPGDEWLDGIWSSATTGPFVVDQAGAILAFDRQGKSWKQATKLSGGALHAIWGPEGQGTQFFVGGASGRIRSCTGTINGAVTCTPMATITNQSIYRIWGTSAANVYAVGAGRTVLRYNGSSWNTVATPPGTQALIGVWGSGPSDVFAVGEQGTILHTTGGAMSAMPSGTNAVLTGVWGTGPRDVVVVGFGTILRLSCK
jgi:hypothetical protein